MKKLILLSLVMCFSIIKLHANPINLANFTCAPITFFLIGHTPQTPDAHEFYGFVTLAPFTSKSYTDPGDFSIDSDTYDFSSVASFLELQAGTFEALRLWDIAPQIHAISLDPSSSENSSPYILPCAGTFYNAFWSGTAVVVSY